MVSRIDIISLTCQNLFSLKMIRRKKNIYLDTCSLINLFEQNRNIAKQLSNKFNIFLSLLNKFEICVYKNPIKKEELLKFCEELNPKQFLPLDFPITILNNFFADFIEGKGKTIWTISNWGVPDFNDKNNVSLIYKYLTESKEKFIVNNKKTREFILKLNKKDLNHSFQNPQKYLNCLFTQDQIMIDLIENIFNIQLNKISSKNKIILSKSEPLIYFLGPLFLGYHRLAIKETNYSPKKNPNSIDIAHCFYLGATDIFVTDENEILTMLNDFIHFKYLERFLKTKKILNTTQLIKMI